MSVLLQINSLTLESNTKVKIRNCRLLHIIGGALRVTMCFVCSTKTWAIIFGTGVGQRCLDCNEVSDYKVKVKGQIYLKSDTNSSLMSVLLQINSMTGVKYQGQLYFMVFLLLITLVALSFFGGGCTYLNY